MSVSGISRIALHRSSSMGGTLWYELELNHDGSATYIGKGFVQMLGTYQGRVDVGAFEALAYEAERLGFFSREDFYSTFKTCSAGCVTTVVRDGHAKRVENEAEGGPDELKELERRIDAIAAAIAWEPGADPHASAEQ